MIENPENYVDNFIDAGADIITVHVETVTHIHRLVNYLKSCNIKPGVALNPSTPLDALEYLLDDISMVLIMSVNPGFGGQSLFHQCYKNKRYKSYNSKKNRKY